MNEIYSIPKEIDKRIDELEAALLEQEPINCPLKHTFLPGLYIRKIFMPKGQKGKLNIITSMVHNTTHPFFVLQGKVSVFSENDGEQIIEAPFDGITLPNTRRVLLIHEDTIWITTHVTDVVPENDSDEAIEEAVKKVGEQILKPYTNDVIGGYVQNNIFHKKGLNNA